MKRWVFFLAVLTLSLFAKGQKNYATASVLSTGKWIKVGTEGEGVFKVTASFLTKAGFTAPISSASIRLYGNGGAMLPEANHLPAPDDLLENQIEVFDGGDGLLDGEDYFLFYAPGANQWGYNDKSKKFEFSKNFYSDLSFYFIQVGDGSGSRIMEKILNGSAVQNVESFVEHLRFERDSFNFLNSGREWFGETFGNGYPDSRIFQVASDGVLPGSQYELTSEVVGRSFNKPNRLNVSLNGNLLFQHSTPASIGTLLEPIANVSRLSKEGITNGTTIAIRYDFESGNASGQSWLNWFDVIFRRTLTQRNDTLLSFRDPSVVANNRLVAYHIASSNPNLKVWEVTKRGEYSKFKTEFLNSRHRFIDDASVFREYISFDPALSKQPVFIEKVDNQNLHGEGFYDMVVVAHPSFLQEARRLAQFRQSNNGLRVLVVDVERVYNEYSSGSPDPSAIRNFLKMLYDRAGNITANRPKYLLLFGGTSYQFKEKTGERKNLVPTYQSPSSLDPLTSYLSDDYFGYLDNDDDINANIPAPLLDVAVGRIPARTVAQAKIAVDKIINYQSKSDFGDWRNEITMVADDEDFDLHLNDAESHATLIEGKQPVWNLNKIYLDAFQQNSGTGGSRYPEVNATITKGMNLGTMLWNYSGHGGNARLAQEAILEKEMLPLWENQNRLPLFVTATCDFAPFDNPAQFSIGEDLLVGRSNGAIGLMTTTRLVFASSNKLINNNFFKSLLQRKSDGRYPSLGEAWLNAKNTTVVESGDYINARKFAMLGDPSMKLLMPEYQVKTIRVTDLGNGSIADTLRALNQYRIEGEVLLPDGNFDPGFNGTLSVKIQDKATNYKTLANDQQSSVRDFKVYDNLIYFGKTKVQSGKFSFQFVVPNDIRFEYGKARVSYYAEDGIKDAQGVDGSLVSGGFGGKMENDKNGPIIQAYLENESFKNGGTVKENPIFIAKLSDQTGIYLGRFGIGHDIRLVIDGDNSSALVLNDYFQPLLNENKAGEIYFQFPKLSEGVHKIELKAWDVFNNSSTAVIDFIVVKQQTIEVERFYNFPNPFSASTTFSFQLNGPIEGAFVTLDVLTLEGKPIKRLVETINQKGLRFIQMKWNGFDVNGKKPQPGIYLARLTIKAKSGRITSKVQKLILL